MKLVKHVDRSISTWQQLGAILVVLLTNACGSGVAPPPLLPDGGFGEAGAEPIPAAANAVECECRLQYPATALVSNECNPLVVLVSGGTVHAPTMLPDGGAGPPYGDSGFPTNVGNTTICDLPKRETVCLPPRFNPNLRFPDGGVVDPAATPPTANEIDAYCTNDVANTLTEANRQSFAGNCNVRVVCRARFVEVNGVVTPRSVTESSCNNPCPSQPFRWIGPNPEHNNRDKATFVTAAASSCGLAADTPLLCRPSSFDPPLAPPDGLIGSWVGAHTRASVTSSTITVTIGSNSPVTTTATGDVEVVNPPCPGSSCSVGLGLNLQIANFVSEGVELDMTVICQLLPWSLPAVPRTTQAT
jgi:hypothetical protein